MTGGVGSTRSPAEREVARRERSDHWRVGFYVGVVVGVFGILLTAVLHGVPWIAALDRLGDDMAQVVYAGGDPGPLKGRPKVWLLDFDFSHESGSQVDQVSAAIEKLTPLEPRTIVIDLAIQRTVTTSGRFVEAVIAATRKSITVVVQPEDVRRTAGEPDFVLAEAGPIARLRDVAHVLFASALLDREADGKVRGVPEAVCLEWKDRSGTREAIPSVAASLEGHTTAGCRREPPQRRIVYSVGRDNLSRSRAVQLITPAALEDPAIRSQLAGAVVLIGQFGDAAWPDIHATPLGLMPGALIHANAMLSPPVAQEEEDVTLGQRAWTVAVAVFGPLLCLAGYDLVRRRRPTKRPLLAAFGLWLGATLIASACAVGAAEAAPFAFGQRPELSESLALGIEIASVFSVAALFAWHERLVAKIMAGRGKPHQPGRGAGHAAGHGLGHGSGHGSGHGPTAADPACRCTSAGEDVVWLLSFMALSLFVLFVVGVLWPFLGALLIPCGLRVASTAPVLVVFLERLIEAGGCIVRQLERLVRRVLGQRTHAAAALVLLFLPAAAHAAEPSREAHPGALSRAATAFLSMLSGRESGQGTVEGRGDLYRGNGAGPLHWLPVLPAAGAKLPAGAQGLCLAWSGGAAPFVITLEGGRSGAALGTSRTEERLACLPAFTMPTEPVQVAIRDGERHRLSAQITPSDTAPTAAEGTGTESALALFVDGGPEWRLEALRRLAVLAPGDAEASKALAALRDAAEKAP